MKKKILKRVVSLLLGALLLAGCALPAGAASPFTDVNKDAWYAPAVEYVRERDWMNGVGNNQFAPQAALDRATFAQILYNLAGQPELPDDFGHFLEFGDVDPGKWYKTPTYWAYWKGLASGTGDGKFSPSQAVTREQMAAILYRYAQYKGYDVTASGDLSGYTDAGAIRPYAEAAMAWANGAGLITGVSDTTLQPRGNSTRAQVATILMRFCQKVAE